jgi:hypothetical protein
VDEQDGKYWHVMILYESKFTTFSKPKNPEMHVSKEFISEIQEFTKTDPPISKKASNNIDANIGRLFDIKSLEDFKRFKSIGAKTFANDSVFLNGILEII